MSAAALAGVVALAAWLARPAPEPMPAPAVRRLLQAQSKLPPEALRALQDLRLVAAVQLTYFSATGRYGLVEELKNGGYLDPRWPRAQAYRVWCEVGEAPGFVCYAQPLTSESLHFRVDSTQAVRYERGRRPHSSSPVFGIR